MSTIGLAENVIKIRAKELFVQVDAEDFEKLSKYKWYLFNGKYPGRHPNQEEVANGMPGVIYMHREVMDAIYSTETVDHISGDTLDNRKSNLRVCSQGMNNLNKPPRADNKCGYKGVRKQLGKKKNPWDSRIQLDGKRITLGHFDNPHDAARMYNFWAADIHGEYAYLNVIKEETTQ